MGLDKTSFGDYTNFMNKYIDVKITDAGRNIDEKNDCTVRAIALCENIPYYQAHDLLRVIADRLNRHGVYRFKYFSLITNYLEKNVYELKHQITLKTFARLHPHGKFFLVVRGHATVMNNGILFDTFPVNENKRIIAYVEF